VSSLLALLGIRRGDVVSFVGAGGKTTLVYRLASEAEAAGLRVLVTSTTHMGALPETTTGPLILEADGDPLPSLERALSRRGRATLLGARIRSDKIRGLDPGRVEQLADRADIVLVEADGARGRSLKLPAEGEPVVPSATTLLIVLVGLDVLGRPMTEERVHRLDRVCAAAGVSSVAVADEATLIRVLRFADGYPGRAPRGARLAAFLNKAESAETRASAARIAKGLVPPYDLVAVGSARGGAAEIWPAGERRP